MFLRRGQVGTRQEELEFSNLTAMYLDIHMTTFAESIDYLLVPTDAFSYKYIYHGIMGRRFPDGGLLRYRK